MELNAVHDKLEDIPEQYRDLYSERNGKFELTGIKGVKTDNDVARVKTSLEAERSAHKETKDKFAPFADLGDIDEVRSKLDRIPELEAAAKGKLDDDAIQEIVDRRVEGTLKSKLAPVERQLAQVTKERDEFKETNTTLLGEKTQRTVHDDVRRALGELKVLPEAHDDALLLADRVFEVGEDGKVVTKDNVGVTPGISAASWLQELQAKRPHWWPASQGGGSRGGGGGGGIADNPWSAQHWNMTKQSQFQKEHGAERAEAAAKAAGSSLGAAHPPASK